MKLIVDANIIISALLKDGKTREILTSSLFEFSSPDGLLESIAKYQDEFIKRMNITGKEFEKLLDFILSQVEIINKEEYNLKLKEAINIMKGVDIDDSIYIALALTKENDGIWSDDSDFEKQSKVKVWKTSEIIEEFNKQESYF